MTEHNTALTEALQQADRGDPTNADAVAYHLNTQRSVISHTAAIAQETELRLYELKATREVLERRANRVMNEIKDVDRAMASLNQAIHSLRGG